ncbi:MAG TPA: thiamine phosphate synthase [Candidatus Polarisedimenticolaceae bacterium]|nr:thiamine phosphate synthase [Candidatus Polarisedimenticolaceae bacterium]
MDRDSGIGRLHVITDETVQTRWSHVELARAAALGGADRVQYREKRPRTTRELVETARRIRRALDGTAARLVLNDRIDVAVAAGAGAVHLGRDDLDPAIARRLVGDSMRIGATANDLEQALRAARLPVDYLGVGPVFGTRSKTAPAPALGLVRLAEIVRAVPLPVIAIGNITVDHVAAVLATGVHGIAVLSAIACAHDPREATSGFARAIDHARSGPVAG